MENKWGNIDELVAEFRLSASKSDVESLKKELILKLSELHPDKTDGAFKSDEQKKNYLRINDAIEYLEKQSLKGLTTIPISEISSVMLSIYR